MNNPLEVPDLIKTAVSDGRRKSCWVSVRDQINGIVEGVRMLGKGFWVSEAKPLKKRLNDLLWIDRNRSRVGR